MVVGLELTLWFRCWILVPVAMRGAGGSDAPPHRFFGLADLRVASTLVVLVVHHGKFDASDGSWNQVLRNVVQLCAGVAVRTCVK